VVGERWLVDSDVTTTDMRARPENVYEKISGMSWVRKSYTVITINTAQIVRWSTNSTRVVSEKWIVADDDKTSVMWRKIRTKRTPVASSTIGYCSEMRAPHPVHFPFWSR
jgi:hypothetical protein